MSDHPVHLVRELHDVTCQAVSIWCEAGDWMRSATQDIATATCAACLDECARYGREAQSRLEELRRSRHPHWVAWGTR